MYHQSIIIIEGTVSEISSAELYGMAQDLNRSYTGCETVISSLHHTFFDAEAEELGAIPRGTLVHHPSVPFVWKEVPNHFPEFV